MTEVQEPSEPPTTSDRAVVVRWERLGGVQSIAESLVMAFPIVVRGNLSNDQAEMVLADGNDVIGSFAANGAKRSAKAFRLVP